MFSSWKLVLFFQVGLTKASKYSLPFSIVRIWNKYRESFLLLWYSQEYHSYAKWPETNLLTLRNCGEYKGMNAG